jgi:hypothetical protein
VQKGSSPQQHSPFPGGKDPGGHITCAQVLAAARKAGAIDPNPKGCCPSGYRKIALVIQDKSAPGFNDYHWYRQGADGKWTHKRGYERVESVDAKNQPITDPARASRQYPNMPNYDRFCGYLCVK